MSVFVGVYGAFSQSPNPQSQSLSLSKARLSTSLEVICAIFIGNIQVDIAEAKIYNRANFVEKNGLSGFLFNFWQP